MSNSLQIWQSGFIKGFKLCAYDQTLYNDVLGHYEGKQIEFCIREKNKKPSHSTHGFYRGVILPICQQSEMFKGWNIDEIHKYFVSRYLKDVVEREINGNSVIIVITLSTGGVSQKRMNQFINDVRRELAENGIVTPEPTKDKPIKE